MHFINLNNKHTTNHYDVTAARDNEAGSVRVTTTLTNILETDTFIAELSAPNNQTNKDIFRPRNLFKPGRPSNQCDNAIAPW